MTDKNQQTALVTGASSGIGTEIATVLAERKMNLVITARREDRLEALRDKLREAHDVEVDIIPHDLGVPDSGEELHRKVKELGKDITVLVNNAGFGVYGNSWEKDLGSIKKMMELNMTSLTTLTHIYCAEMVERGAGRILQVSSIGAFQPSPLYAVYSATKAYVLSFSQAMNWELKGTGVTITTMCPGMTDSEFHAVADHLKPKSVEMTMMTCRKVAEIGVKSMLRGKAVVTPGFINKLTGFFVKLFPRSWATAVAGKMMTGKREDVS